MLNKKEKGVYLLVLKLKKNQRLSAGNLPETSFKSGTYIYVGRSRLSLEGRFRRHLRKEKKLFWHIDYFLQKAAVEEVWIKRDFFDECQTAADIKNFWRNSLFPQRKFGSSDCRCTSHLVYLARNSEDLESLRKKLSFEKVDIHGNQA
jgi:sugar fermentation stimulation protein A